jgi:hypothetical protein
MDDNMKWILFLDDIRFPVDASLAFSKDELVIIARSMDDAVWYIRRHGIPYQIHFDHDLADEHYIVGDGEKTGYTFAKWLCDYIMDNNLQLPTGFGFFVHSQNPVGAENIRCYMNNFLKQMEK